MREFSYVSGLRKRWVLVWMLKWAEHTSPTTRIHFLVVALSGLSLCLFLALFRGFLSGFSFFAKTKDTKLMMRRTTTK